MGKHAPADEMKKNLNDILSKINAMEIVAPNEFEKGVVKILKALVEGEIHSINELEHLKKAIDLLTLELFNVQNKIRG
jgi:hypothetical protein